LEIEFSRGWQQSIFDDGLDGAWTIRIQRELEPAEQALLQRAYAHLRPAKQQELRTRLTRILTGEMQPFYIFRYGFYEGHTSWRTDPIVIAFLFGLKPLEEIEAAFAGQLHDVLTRHFGHGCATSCRRCDKKLHGVLAFSGSQRASCGRCARVAPHPHAIVPRHFVSDATQG
jgi:hypothetical protein